MEVNNDDYCVDDGLSLAYRSIDIIPDYIINKYTSNMRINKIDLKETNIKDLSNLTNFKYLTTLILDYNEIKQLSLLQCPKIPLLHTIWLNNNHIDDLPLILDEVIYLFPNVKYISMLNNPCCNGLMNIISPDMESYRLYRLYVIFRIPTLITLDWIDVTNEEVREAKLRGQYAVKRKATSKPINQNNLIIIDNTNSTIVGSDVKTKSAYQGKLPPNNNNNNNNSNPKKKIENKNSEGNRFIVNSQL